MAESLHGVTGDGQAGPQDDAQHDPQDGGEHRDVGAALSLEAGTHPAARAATDALGSLMGTTIGHYLVEERLGGGAMASVYRARDQISNTDVAIKVLLPGADSVMQARFRREARMVSTLMHPHIVRTLQVGRSGGIIYIAMELVEGASLGDLLEKHGRLAVGDVARLLAPVAEALAYAHAQGIIHRDVKPSNILLQRAVAGAAESVLVGGLPYPVIPLLSDFGIARALDAPELTNAGRTIGTPAFMAPEQCAGSADIDGRADVYALGAVLYRCLVGRAPYTGTTTQILHAHVYDPLLIPDAVADALPPAMVRVMARAMMKDPAQRFERIEQMADALREVALLPDSAMPEGGDELVDPTMTMASLPVAPSPATSTSRVLVAASTPVSSAPTPTVPRSPLKAMSRPGSVNTTVPRAIPVAPPPSTRDRERRGRWGIFVLVGALALLTVIGVGLLINSVLPDGEAAEASNATATALAVVTSQQTPAPAVVPDLVVGGDSTPAPDSSASAQGEAGASTPGPTPTASGSATPIPTPSVVSLPFAWELGQSFFDDGDWDAAVVWLNVVRRIVEGNEEGSEEGNEEGSAPLVEAVDDVEIDPQRVDEMLTISYLGLATDAAASGRWAAAIEQLDNALELTPSTLAFVDIAASLSTLADLQEQNDGAAQEERKSLLAVISERMASYASEVEAESRICDAVMLVDNALQIAVSEPLQDRRDALQEACAELQAADAVAQIGGTILYSSEGGDGGYNIWRLPVISNTATSMQSVLVVGNGAQPQLSVNGGVLAYYSPPHAGQQDGLFGVRVNGLSVMGSAERYGAYPEDSRDSPPSWDGSGAQIAYSTSRGNEAAHIYVAAATANSVGRDLGFGKDPAWRPGYDLLVFNGPDTAGQEPGLRAMRASGDGSDRYPLTGTLNGNDQRPAWSPDGNYVVFMSKDRAGGNSWEVYRFDWQSGEVMLLTDGHPAQDGLPAVSPDGEWVVFMSDRGGRWNLWYVSIDGGPVHLLSEISGQPIAWLEHSVQWVR